MSKKDKLLLEWPDCDMVAGIDECGRGCGAGPVVVSSVILPKGFSSPLIRDSKKLSEKERLLAYDLILKNALDITCEAGSAIDINSLGINKVTFNTAHKCLDKLNNKPNHLLIDGIVWEMYSGKFKDTPYTLVPQGDDKYTCIAAASIIAKVRRDEYMTKLDAMYPNFDWKSNKGYLTPKHIEALKKHGKNRYHRDLYVKNHLK